MAGIGGDASPMGESGIRDLLEAAVKDEGEKESVRKHATEALGYLGTEASLDVLSPLLSAGNPYAQDAAKAVGRIGERVTEQQEITTKVELSKAGELLLDVFRSADTDELRLVAAAGLSLMGAQPVEALLEDLRGGSPELRPWIAAILGAIGKPATDAVLEARGAVQEAEGARRCCRGSRAQGLVRRYAQADRRRQSVGLPGTHARGGAAGSREGRGRPGDPGRPAGRLVTRRDADCAACQDTDLHGNES